MGLNRKSTPELAYSSCYLRTEVQKQLSLRLKNWSFRCLKGNPNAIPCDDVLIGCQHCRIMWHIVPYVWMRASEPLSSCCATADRRRTSLTAAQNFGPSPHLCSPLSLSNSVTQACPQPLKHCSIDHKSTCRYINTSQVPSNKASGQRSWYSCALRQYFLFF